MRSNPHPVRDEAFVESERTFRSQCLHGAVNAVVVCICNMGTNVGIVKVAGSSFLSSYADVDSVLHSGGSISRANAFHFVFLALCS